MSSRSERRYGTSRWRRVREMVLRRDAWQCWFAGCERFADVADHIERVTPYTTDGEFFNVGGLRASCRRHNLARSLIAIFEGAEERPRRGGLYSYGRKS